MDKILTAEELQDELRTLWAMTEESSPSRVRLAGALISLSERVADSRDSLVDIQTALKEKDGVQLKKTLDGLKGSFAAKYLIEAMRRTATSTNDVSQLLGRVK